MDLLFTFDIVAVFFFGMSGTLTAMKYNKLDLFGLVFVALITAVGGGTVRDIILDAHPIAWVSHSAYFIAIVSGYLFALLFAPVINKLARPIVSVDALGVAFAAIVGLEKSMEYGATPVTAVIFSIITATVGGIIRDTICNEVPMVLRKEIYASAVLLGAGVYLFIDIVANQSRLIAEISGFATIVIVRLMAVRFSWDLDLVAIRHRRNQIARLLERRKRKGLK